MFSFVIATEEGPFGPETSSSQNKCTTCVPVSYSISSSSPPLSHRFLKRCLQFFDCGGVDLSIFATVASSRYLM